MGCLFALLLPTTPALADGGLRVTADATYTVKDDKVKVVVDFTVTNLTPNKTSGYQIIQYYYPGISISVHEEAKNVKGSQGASIRRNKKRDGYREVNIRFPNLYYQRTDKFRVTFDLPGAEPRSETSDIRVNPAYVWFYALAWGDKGRSSVDIKIPSDFTTWVQGGKSDRIVKDGFIIYRAEDLDPAEWWLVVRADQPDALEVTEVTAGDEKLTVKSWPGDDEWRTQVTDMLATGVPVLEELTGLDWPVEGSLEVTEVGIGDLEGYGGIFIDAQSGIRMTETLDDHLTVHEAAHAYFNQTFSIERWITEGFADEYAARTLRELGYAPLSPDPVSVGDDAAVELNLWFFPGRRDEETEATEAYGYNTSWTVVRRLMDDVGEENMRLVMDSVDEDLIAYRGEGDPERENMATDWKRFLDLLEEVGGADQADYLYRQYVASDAQVRMLDERKVTRADYQKLVDEGGEWNVPIVIRDPMAEWKFETATERMVDARKLLGLRTQLIAKADALGLTPPPSLEAAYDSAQTGFRDAEALALAQIRATDQLAAAQERLNAPRDFFTQVGLWREDPGIPFMSARTAFEADQMDLVEKRTIDSTAMITGALAIGRQRVLWAAVGLALVLLTITLIVLIRRRNKRRKVVVDSTALDVTTNGHHPETTTERPDDDLVRGNYPTLVSDRLDDDLTFGESDDPTG